MAGSSAQFDEILQTPEPEEPPVPIELTGPQYVKTLAGASAPFPYFDPLQISSKVCLFCRPPAVTCGRVVLLPIRSRAFIVVFCRLYEISQFPHCFPPSRQQQ